MKKAFTLIELLVVICILGVLSSLIVGNFLTSLKKGRDTQRKSDLEQIQRANELYYEDNGTYATAETQIYGGSSGDQFCHPNGCGTKIYMVKVPKDPLNKCQYDIDPAGDGYVIYAPLENENDTGPGVKQAGYTGCSIGCCVAPYNMIGRYAVTSSGVTIPP